MKFFRDLISRKRPAATKADAPIVDFADIADAAGRSGDQLAASSILDNVSSKSSGKAQAPAIWDSEDDLAPVAELEEMKAPPASARARRTKTRLIGFESSAGVVDLFDSTPKTEPSQRAKFPVGWVVVTDGPGRGECFSLEAGMSQMGRGEDQAIQLDFGDNSISRTNHAAIVYDNETHTFLLGHGGKSNLVRLNNKPVISNEELTAGDMINIGETTLRFAPLCSADFNWTDETGTEENDDVAIA